MASSIELAPGAGWGDGSHPTTQLCLQAITVLAPKGREWRMLDFGSGSGILSIRAAQLGAMVCGVEVDPQGIAHAKANTELNGVTEKIRFHETLDDLAGPYDLIVANILRAVLLEFSGELVRRLRPDGILILSGLAATDALR